MVEEDSNLVALEDNAGNDTKEHCVGASRDEAGKNLGVFPGPAAEDHASKREDSLSLWHELSESLESGRHRLNRPDGAGEKKVGIEEAETKHEGGNLVLRDRSDE